jgi:hypothetical protein
MALDVKALKDPNMSSISASLYTLMSNIPFRMVSETL